MLWPLLPAVSGPVATTVTGSHLRPWASPHVAADESYHGAHLHDDREGAQRLRPSGRREHWETGLKEEDQQQVQPVACSVSVDFLIFVLGFSSEMVPDAPRSFLLLPLHGHQGCQEAAPVT